MPIRFRLTLLNALVMGAILLILGLSLFFLLRDALISETQDAARTRAAAIARDVEAGEQPNAEDAEELALEGVFLVVRDGRGEILFQSAGLRRGEDAVWRHSLDSGRPAGGTADLSRESGRDFVYAVPVSPPVGAARIVEAGKPYGPVRQTLKAFAGVLAAGTLAAFLLSVAGAYLLARASLRPVDAVTVAARDISEGELGRRLPVARKNDEIGRLTTTMNDLLDRLEAAFSRRGEALERQRRFAADASHELRTPLTSIGGHARMLDEWALREDPERARRSVREIRREAGRMRELVEALLSLARGDEGAPLNPRPHDLAATTGEAVEAARASAAGKVRIEYTPPGQRIVLAFDRDRVRQAVSVLLDNAVKYTPHGGSVAVEVSEGDGVAAVEVSDTGIGISERDLREVFDRFYRADESRSSEGAGLGLPIARQIARAHGGEIEATSTPGHGSTFALFLPKR